VFEREERWKERREAILALVLRAVISLRINYTRKTKSTSLLHDELLQTVLVILSAEIHGGGLRVKENKQVYH
jgi:hypothetical protein